jgi:hypothetical protein
MSHRETGMPRPSGVSAVDPERLADCIDACFTCAQACLACAEHHLNEAALGEPAAFVRDGLGCADLCEATGLLLTRHHAAELGLVRAFLDTCAAGCRAWADASHRDGDADERCRECREACLRCERACRELALAL